jgi:2-octaprenyl-6-methoxyphenol hydroxylase
VLRDTGLGAVNRLPAVKGLFVAEAAGKSGVLPKLLRGERL